MTDLYYTSSGDGEPLVILHGLFGSSKNWQSLARQFSSQFQVFCIDLRNHGQSFHDNVMNYDVMAEDVAQLLKHLNLSACRLLGHSMGGKVAMALSLKYPQLVARLIVADIAPVAYAHHYDDLIDPVIALPLDSIDSRTQADHMLRPNIPEDQLRAFLLQSLVREHEQWHWRINWVAIQQEMDSLTGFEILPDDWIIETPTLFIRGDKSDYVGDAEREVIEAHFSDAKLASIADAGHWLHAEKPEQFAQLVVDFLKN